MATAEPVGEKEHLHVLIEAATRNSIASIAEREERSIGAVTRRLLRAGLERYGDGAGERDQQ